VKQKILYEKVIIINFQKKNLKHYKIIDDYCEGYNLTEEEKIEVIKFYEEERQALYLKLVEGMKSMEDIKLNRTIIRFDSNKKE